MSFFYINPLSLGTATFAGNVTISGNLQVNGTTTLVGATDTGQVIIDITNTEALLVRQNADAADIFIVDTTNSVVFLPDDVELGFGNTSASPDAHISWNTAQTVDALFIGLPAGQNVLTIAERADGTFDFAHGAQTNPTIFIHSATQSTVQFGSLVHDQTNFLISNGNSTGQVIINAENGIALRDANTTALQATSDGTDATWSAAGGDNIIIAPTTSGNLTLNAAGADFGVLLQNRTITPGATHEAVIISPTWAAENFQHTGLQINATQNGANTISITGLGIALTKATGATTLAAARGLVIGVPTITGTITTVTGILIANQADVNATASAGITINNQTGNSDSLAIAIEGTGGANAIEWGGSALQYANAAEQITFADSTDADGIRFVLATGNQSIRTVDADSTSLILQDQTFTSGTAHSAIQITPTWATENFAHQALRISATQNGANSSTLTGLGVVMTKATGATTLATIRALSIEQPSVTGIVTTTYGLNIEDQSTSGGTTATGIRINTQSANATTTRAIIIESTGKENGIAWGNSAIQYANAPNQVRFTDATDARGITIELTAAGAQGFRSTGGNLAFATTGATTFDFQPGTATSGTPTQFQYVAPAHTTLTAAGMTEVNWNFNRTVTITTGAAMDWVNFQIIGPTDLVGTAATQTIDSARTFNIDRAPRTSNTTNTTITESSALGVDHGEGTADSMITASIGNPGILNGFGVNTEVIGALIGSGDTHVGNQTATTGFFASLDVEATALDSTTNTRTITNASSLRIVGEPTNAGNVVFTNGPYALWVDRGKTRLDGGGTTRHTSAAGSVLEMQASTVNSTNASSTLAIGATQSIGITTLTNNSATLTFTDATSLYIAGIPVASTNVAITNTATALWVDAGNVRFDGDILLPTSGSAINFNSGDVTLTHSSNALTIAGGNFVTAANIDIDMSAGGRFFGGGIQFNKQDLGANTNLTLDENDSVVNVTTGAVSVNTITLPAASGNEGMIISVYLVTDGGQNANVVRAGADVIQNGSADLANTQVALDDAGDFVMLQCVNSTMWQILVNSGGTVT